MTDNTIKFGSILFAAMIIILPIGWGIVTYQPPGPYFATEINQVLDALKSSGLNFCDQTDSTWKVNGALGGKSIQISSDCSNEISDSTIFIHTQKFDSEQDRDNAIRLIQRTIFKNDINGAVSAFGSFVIVVQGPTGGAPVTETEDKVKAALQK